MCRLRNNTNAYKLIEKYPNYKKINEIALINNKIYLEIGCGKGHFLISSSLQEKEIFHIGIEKNPTIILKALKKINPDLVIKNLIFTMVNIEDINIKQFKRKIDKIFINFPDPWPKKRHEKRRITWTSFINIYKQILKKNGLIELKTDNEKFYHWTINQLQNRNDCKIIYQTNNLYVELDNAFNKNNIPTEYETKFLSMQKKINKIIWKFL